MRRGRADIAAAVDRRATTPFAAINYLKTVRALFQWAVGAGLVRDDPTAGVKAARPKTSGFMTWTEDDIQRFEARWPIGTRQRLALAILLYTGLRRGDACILGRQHIREMTVAGEDGRPRTARLFCLRTQKTGAEVYIPVRTELQEIIDASPCGDLSFLGTEYGRTRTKEGFGEWFAAACREAGVDGRAHGLRKAGATRLANNGATERELQAIFGWSEGSRESAAYTRAADRLRLAVRGMDRFGAGNEMSPSMPAPADKVRTK